MAGEGREPVTFWNTCVLRVLAAVWLLLGPGTTFKVICMSPTGHEAVEDWLARCCAPPAGTGGFEVSEPTSCQGCTDYPIDPAIKIDHGRTNVARADLLVNPAALVATPIPPALTASANWAASLYRELEFTDSPPAATSLRC